MLRFLSENGRWLGAGFLLIYGSSFGQTWFIALFAGTIQVEHGLSAGGWGGLYTLATLSAAGPPKHRGSLPLKLSPSRRERKADKWSSALRACSAISPQVCAPDRALSID